MMYKVKRDYILSSKDELTNIARSLGINTWNELTRFVKSLPYGRNENRIDFDLVLLEEKGTCSSKHALLKSIADLNHVPNIKLILGMYKMNQLNTPKIGVELSRNSIEYIPEAHCYLKIKGQCEDFTANTSNFGKIENDIINELEIEPTQVSEFKVNYHREFILNWLRVNHLKLDLDGIWKIREQCIRNLTN